MRESEPRLLEELPYSDGAPVAESHVHLDQLVLLINSLRCLARMRGMTDVTVAGNQFFYFEEQDWNQRLAPDLYVFRGLPDPEHPPNAFPVWPPNARPELIVEIASPGTWKEDLGRKRERYQQIEVPEYVVFDPQVSIKGRGRFLAYRRANGYREEAVAERFQSWALGAPPFSLQVVGEILRVVDEHGVAVPGDPVEGEAKGRAEGRAEGRGEGRAEEGRALLQVLVTEKFGAVSPELLARLRAASPEEVRRWTTRVLRAATQAELFGDD